MDASKVKIMRPMRFSLFYLALSSAFIIPGLISLFVNGLKLGIDFTGGSTIVWQAPTMDVSLVKSKLEEQEVKVNSIAQSKDVYTLQTSQIESSTYQAIKEQRNASHPLKELSFETIGASLGAELLQKTLAGLALASTLIMFYVAIRFKSIKYGVSAILAMLHDLIIVIGVFSLMGKFWGVEVDTLFVTALLTILSFSVHDTIVVYDRIRELKKKHGYLDFEEIVNRAVVETMGRSINNSMTIVFMLLTMYLLGGETTKWFIFALLIGTISGTYSSTFTAAPLVVLWDKWERNKKRG